MEHDPDKEDDSEADDGDTEDGTRGVMALCALDDDALRVIYGGLCNPLDPSVAVAFSSLCKGLWEPTKELHTQLRDAHKVAAMLCHRIGLLNFYELCEVRPIVLEPRVALAVSNASQRLWEQGPTQQLLQGLWEPTQRLLQLLGVEHEAATVLCTKMRMRSCKALRESNMVGCQKQRLTVADLTTLGTLGAVLPKLKHLCLRDPADAAGPDGVQRLAEGLGTGALPALISLEVNWGLGSSMHVGDAGASALAAALGRGALLRLNRLFLCRAAIGDAGLVALAPALRRRPALEELTLHHNPFGDEGIAALVAPPLPVGAPPPPAGALTKLRTLDLRYTQITDAGCAALTAALDNDMLPALANLNLVGTPVSAAARAVVQVALARSSAAARVPT
eukprot:scaffold19563_cov66-Phaeocystis_antarctica.AAC.2